MKKQLAAGDSGWPQGMLDHIRNSDETVLKGCEKILSFYQTDLLPCESISELLDVAGMLSDIPQPDSFIAEALSLLPKWNAAPVYNSFLLLVEKKNEMYR